MRQPFPSNIVRSGSLVAIAVATCLNAPALNAAQSESAAEELADVVVTGSRLPASSTFVSPTPTTTVSAAQLEVSAPESLAAGLRTLPSIVPGGGPTAGGGTANGGQNFLNMRGLGTDRTLILVDGRRFVPSGPAITIDTNLIPQALVQRVEVVTGGASAAYGSDAVAGVVNFILDKRYTGLKGSVSHGQSEFGDNVEDKASVTFGTGFADGRGHIVGSVEYFEGQGVDGSAREFRRTASNMIRNPSGSPTWTRITDLRTPFTAGGLIIAGTGGSSANNASFQGRQFAGGQVIPYDWGTYATKTATGSQNGGDGFRVSTGQEIVRPLERQSAFVHAEFDINDSVRIFAEGTYGYTEAAFQSSPVTRTVTVRRDNAFLVRDYAALVAEMQSKAVSGLSINRFIGEIGDSLNVNINEARNLVLGVEGDIGDWTWQASYSNAENRNRNFMDPNLIVGNLSLAVDAVVNPATGSITCRSTLTAPTNGCVPFNVLGAGSPSAAALDYVVGRSDFTTLTKQDFAEVQISGSLFALPAGNVSAALGAEYRKISAVTLSDALSNSGAFRLVNQQDFKGSYEIKEIYAETLWPLLSDVWFARQMDLNLAARHANYSTSGGVTTWKSGLNWQTTDSIRLRGTYSRDTRAPNLTELFATGRQNNITVVDSLTNQSYFSVPNRTFGNANLKPEEATTRVFGVVYEPQGLDGVRLAVDFWNIRIEDAIANIGGQNAVEQCNLSNQTSAICAFVVRDPVSRAITATQTAPFNFSVQKTHGVDYEASLRRGQYTWRVLASNVKENISLSPLVVAPFDDAGTNTASQPHWRGLVSVNYEDGPWNTSVQGRYLGSTTWDRTRNSVGFDTDFNRVGSVIYVDAQASYEMELFGGQQQVFLNVQNLLDRPAPFAPNTGGATPLPTNPNLYDQVGRMWRLGLRFEL